MLIYQPPEGYRYNSDSIFLYDFVARYPLKGRVLDVGTGVGILGLLAQRDFPIVLDAIDKQAIAVAYAQHNFVINGMDVRVYHEDFSRFDPGERYDYILSNPPFYGEGVTQSTQPHLNASRYAHHLPLRALVTGAKRLLRPRGMVLLCYDAKQTDALLSALREAKLNPETIRFVHPKADREAKIVLVAARLNSRADLKVLPPLIVFDAASQYRPEAQAAFERADTHSIKAERKTAKE